MKLVGKIFASLYSVVFTFVLIAFLVAFFAKSMISKEFISITLSSINFSEISLKEFEIGDYAEKYGENATLEDALIGELTENGFTEEKAKELVNDKKIREFLADKIGEAVESVVYNKDIENVTTKEIKDTLESLELTDENYEQIKDFINDIIDEINKEVKDARGN